MGEIGTYQVLNQINNKPLNICIEWQSSSLKILLLTSETSPWMGEMNAEEINYFSRELSKSSEEYLHDIEEAFLGTDLQTKFSFENNLLTWKRGIWILGKIKMKPIVTIESISPIMYEIIAYYHSTEGKLQKLQIENEHLKEMKLKLTNDINKMIEVKNNMETELYRKFVLLLNAKKKKIRELEAAVKNNVNTVSVFDADTDDTGNSDDEDNQQNNTCKKDMSPRKHKIRSENIERQSKLRKSDNTEVNVDTKLSPVASTSKTSFIKTADNLSMQSQSSNETECELQLNYTEDDNTSEKHLHSNEELESDMSFSQ